MGTLDTSADGRALSRRAVLGAAAVTGAAVATVGVVAVASRPASAQGTMPSLRLAADAVGAPAHGRQHPEGVVTPQPVQLRLRLVALDVTDHGGTGAARRAALSGLLADLSAATAALRGTGRGRTTVTLGVGVSLFDERFGLAERRPVALRPLPQFRNDQLVASRSDGDLLVQVCADDDRTVDEALALVLGRVGDRASVRWQQSGQRGHTAFPRNLFGFNDGQANPDTTDADAMATHVWVDGARDVPWLDGGTYVVVRRIRMNMTKWSHESVDDQERIMGRSRESGAPLTGGIVSDDVDLDATGPDRRPVVALNAHVRVMNADTNRGIEILRRGFDYVDGSDDRGLVFMAFTHDPHATFVPLQHRMANQDALHDYVTTTASGVYAVLPDAVLPDGGQDPAWHRILLG